MKGLWITLCESGDLPPTAFNHQ